MPAFRAMPRSVRFEPASGNVASVIRASFFEPAMETIVERAIGTDAEVTELVQTILALSSDRGHPAADLVREDGSAVTIGTDGEWATLVWIDSLGASHHSVGSGATKTLVYDYFGSWSEVAADFQASLGAAVAAVQQFVQQGSPVTDQVLFVPD